MLIAGIPFFFSLFFADVVHDFHLLLLLILLLIFRFLEKAHIKILEVFLP